MPIIPIHVRAWLYRVTLALVPLLAAYGILSASHGGLWLCLVAACLGISPATALTHLADPPPAAEK